MTTATDTYTDSDRACGGLAMTMAMASGAMKRKDWKVAKVLIDNELALLLRSPLLHTIEVPGDEAVLAQLRAELREAMKK